MCLAIHIRRFFDQSKDRKVLAQLAHAFRNKQPDEIVVFFGHRCKITRFSEPATL